MGDHGPIEDKGNHNHHDRSYKIHITKTGKIVTCNRQDIKPTSISVEHYLWQQLFQHTKTYPLGNILDHLEKYPSTPNIANTMIERPNSNCTAHEHAAPESIQNNNEKVQKESKTNEAAIANIVTMEKM